MAADAAPAEHDTLAQIEAEERFAMEFGVDGWPNLSDAERDR